MLNSQLSVAFSQDLSFATGTVALTSRGEQDFDNEHYADAIIHFEKALRLDSTAVDVLVKLAQSHNALGHWQKSADYYDRAVHIEGRKMPETHRDYGEVLLKLGDRTGAEQQFRRFTNLVNKNRRVNNRLSGLADYNSFFRDSLAYELEVLPMNSDEADFSPVFYGEGLVFLSARGALKPFRRFDRRSRTQYLQFYYYEPTQGASELLGLDWPKNKLHNGPVVFFNENREAYVTRSGSDQKQETVTLRLFHAWKTEGNEGLWMMSELPFSSSEFSTGHPATTADGSMIIFVSDRPGGFGGTDLYLSTKHEDSWSKPRNLGEDINTSGDEMFPFLTSTNELYFASDGHAGLGGLDIFKASLESATLVNPGYPVNSRYDDFGLIINPTGDQGYLSSNRQPATGDNIYEFRVRRIHITCRMVNVNSREVIEGEFEIKDSETGEEVVYQGGSYGAAFDGWKNKRYTIFAHPNTYELVSNEIAGGALTDGDQGIELLVAPTAFKKDMVSTKLTGQGHIINGQESNQASSGLVFSTHETALTGDTLFISLNFKRIPLHEDTKKKSIIRMKGINSDRYYAQVPEGWQSVDPLPDGTRNETAPHEPSGMMHEIGPFLFDFDQATIRESTREQLDLLHDILISSGTPLLTITGHADSKGSEQYNSLLSERRAEAARKYLRRKGYPKKLIRTIGMGEGMPVFLCEDDNDCSPEQYEANRRIEIYLRNPE